MRICVIGQGYVGLTLSLVLADCGFKILGIDSNQKVISSLKNGKPTLSEKDVKILLNKHLGKNYNVSEKIPEEIFDVFIISVGTPLNKENIPILDHILESCDAIGAKLSKNCLVILRSTVPVGVTRNKVVPKLESISRLKAGQEFEVVFAPERTAEGVAIEELRKNPQIIGGMTKKGVEKASDIFRKMTETIIPVSSIESAEMIKLIDNTYRDVHFAYSNEIALICDMLKIDARECIEKANYNYSRNKIPIPSPGVGGPCLSKDPYILAHVGKQLGYEPKLIMHGRKVNEFVPSFLASKILSKLESIDKRRNDAKIFVIGFAFKGHPETDDTRDSPTLILINQLKKEISQIYGYDPVVSEQEIERLGAIPIKIEEGFQNADCVIMMNNHKSYLDLDIKRFIKESSKPCVFVDCWNMVKELSNEEGVIYTTIGGN